MIGDVTSSATGQPPNGIFERVFGPKRQEFVAVAWSFAYFFCVLSSYYIIRPVREEMAVGGGPNTIPLLFIGTFVAMIFATSIFGWVASRYPRRTFLPWVYLFFISNILIFWFVFSQARNSGEDYVWLGRVFFVWLSVFNLFVVSVFWSFMADIYTREQGRRLFGFITSGGSIGALIGGLVTSSLVTNIGFQNLLPISAAVLLVAVFCIGRLKGWVHNEHEDEIDTTVESDEPLGGSPFAGITHLFSSKYFLGIALMSLIASLLGTTLYMFRADLIGSAILDPDVRIQFFSNMNIASNALALIAQMFLVKQVVTRFGIGRSLCPVSGRLDDRILHTLDGPNTHGRRNTRRGPSRPRIRLRQAIDGYVVFGRYARGEIQDQERHRHGDLSRWRRGWNLEHQAHVHTWTRHSGHLDRDGAICPDIGCRRAMARPRI